MGRPYGAAHFAKQHLISPFASVERPDRQVVASKVKLSETVEEGELAVLAQWKGCGIPSMAL